jgi:hypothetical protein
MLASVDEMDVRARLRRDFRLGTVTKIAIDKQADSGENRGHEDMLAGVLFASGRLCGQEAAGCGNPATHTKPAPAAHGRTHPTLRGRQAGKFQHGHLQLFAPDHRDRFKNGAHHSNLQSNQR